MIRKHSEQKVEIKDNLRGGNGSVRFEEIITGEEMYEKGRLFSRIVLEPGCSIGYHNHENEMEAYYVLNGTAELSDNGESIILNKYDAAYTPSGHGHSITNCTNETLELLAVILYK